MTSDALEAAVRVALTRVLDPEIRKPITDLDMVANVSVAANGAARIGISLTIVGCPAAARIERDVREATLAVAGVTSVDVEVGVMTPHERRALIERLRGRGTRASPFTPDSLTSVFAITSGKGGVGKSTITANVAVALAARGLSVGVVDADVFGFSIPAILGLVDAEGHTVTPTPIDDMILPPIAHGVKVISMAMFIDRAPSAAQTAVAWRGPLLHRTIQQFLTDVYFGDLDVLLLDLPPGTGDVAISVGQLLPHASVIVVTTPQRAATDIAERSGIVARSTGQTVFGVVENMAALTQPDGTVLDIFGSGGGRELARRLSLGHDEAVPLLSSVPLSVGVREGGDTGSPIVVSDPDDPASAALFAIADAIASRGRALRGRNLGISVTP